MNIRRATYADKPAIFEFLKSAYAGRSEFKFPHRWEWAFENNPFLVGDQPPVWIAEAPDGRVVGQSAALVEPLFVEGREYLIGWGIDFFVLPEYRGQGLGTQLQAANNEANEVFMSLSMASGAASIKTRLGMADLPEVPLLTRILHHDPGSVRRTLKNRIPWFPLAGALSLPAARILTRLGAPGKYPTQPSGILVRQEALFTEAFDRLWDDLADAFSALVRRDARFLTWKYRHQPHVQYDIFGGYRDGRLAGYSILRRTHPPERNAGILADLFVHPDDVELSTALIEHAVVRFYKQGVTYMNAATSVAQFARHFHDRKFKTTRMVTPLARAPFPLPRLGWLLGKGDHDWDQYPLA